MILKWESITFERILPDVANFVRELGGSVRVPILLASAYATFDSPLLVVERSRFVGHIVRMFLKFRRRVRFEVCFRRSRSTLDVRACLRVFVRGE